jgi:hypothetical protein
LVITIDCMVDADEFYHVRQTTFLYFFTFNLSESSVRITIYHIDRSNLGEEASQIPLKENMILIRIQ